MAFDRALDRERPPGTPSRRARRSTDAAGDRRRRRAGSFLAASLAVLVISLVAACESGPARAWQGARAYASGTEALDRGEGRRAVLELERAAELIPHGSEIQNHLGLAYWATGDVVRARAAFVRALDLDCDNGAAQRNLEQLEASGQVADPERSDGPRAALDGGPNVE